MKLSECSERLREVLARPRPRALYEAIYRDHGKHTDAAASAEDGGSPAAPPAELFAFLCTTCSINRRAYFAAMRPDREDDGSASSEAPLPAPVLEPGGGGQAAAAAAAEAVEAAAPPADEEAPPYVVAVCANRVSADELETVVVHELVHAYDHLARGEAGRLDLRDGADLACSEVRAAREGECAGGAATALGGLVDWRRRCASYRAKLATRAFFPAEIAEHCVEDVFERCYADLQPEDVFGEGSATAAAD